MRTVPSPLCSHTLPALLFPVLLEKIVVMASVSVNLCVLLDVLVESG